MEPFHIHKGKVVPLMLNHIDTDQIIPKQYLKRIERTGFGEFLFDDWRYLDNRQLNPTFELNKEARKGASILVTGENFGCGSSREHAPWALHDYGLKVIIAGSFADIFYMNCIKNGMLPIVASNEVRGKITTLASEEVVTINLEKQLVLYGEDSFHFEIEEEWKNKLLQGLDDIALTLSYEKQIQLYEKKQLV
ncbi:MAG: 3-isopropylmalate dehydratase small subunit [Bacillaceae bacterium]